jgi:hypothetical protein
VNLGVDRQIYEEILGPAPDRQRGTVIDTGVDYTEDWHTALVRSRTREAAVRQPTSPLGVPGAGRPTASRQKWTPLPLW